MQKLTKKAILLLISFYVLIASEIVLFILAENGRGYAFMIMGIMILLIITIKKLIKEGSLF